MEDLKEKLLSYLETNDLKFKDSGEKVQHCCLNPEHIEENPSAFTKIDGTESFTHCSSCGYHLNYERLIKFLGGKLDTVIMFKSKMDKLFKKLKEKETLSLKTKEDNVVILPSKDKEFKASYRGISSATFLKVGAYVTPETNYYKKRIIFPIYNRNNELISFEAVSFDKEILPKVLRPKNVDTTTLFGFENIILNNSDFKRNDMVFICEGLFSALSFIEVGYKGIFNFGVGSIENKLEVLYQNGIKYVILVGDFDKAGRKFNSECYHLLKNSFKIVFFKFPWKESKDKFDSNDLIKLDLLEKSVESNIKNIV